MALIKFNCTVEDKSRKEFETTILLNDEIILAIINNEVIIKDKYLNSLEKVVVKDYHLSNLRLVDEK